MRQSIKIQLLGNDDLAEAVDIFAQQVYGGDRADAIEHFEDHAEGLGDTFVARVGGALAGYVTIR